MSLTTTDMKWLDIYQGAKDTVQGVLELIDDPDGLSLLLSPQQYGTAVGALTSSIKGRGKIADSIGSDSGHAHRLNREKAALATLTTAHNQQLKYEADLLKAKQQKQADEQKKQQALHTPNAFPVFDGGTHTTKKQLVYKAPPKQPFSWGTQTHK